jgi:hypothetical protein
MFKILISFLLLPLFLFLLTVLVVLFPNVMMEINNRYVVISVFVLYILSIILNIW